VKVRHVARISISNVDKKSAEGELPVRLCNYLDVYNNQRITADLNFMPATATEDQIREFHLKAGDVLITKDSETPDDIGIPAFVPDEIPGLVCGYHLAIVRPDTSLIDGRYLYWAISSATTQAQFSAAAAGITRFGLRQESIGSVDLRVPHLPRQRAIAHYLDTETARIDQLIGLKRSLALELARRDSSMIDALTTGHGNETRIRRLLAIAITDGPHETPDFLDQGIPFVSVEHLVDNAVDFQRCWYVSKEAHNAYCRKCRPQLGDVLLCKTGATIGKTAVVETNRAFSIWSPLALLRPDQQKVMTRYLWYSIRSLRIQSEIRLAATQSTQPNISMPDIADLKLDVPRLEVQKGAIAALDKATGTSEAVRRALGRSINRLSERRQAVISGAVNGQIPIPGVAA
jgi:type I restriction enzyme, S subunit